MRKALYILGQLNDADVQWMARHGTSRMLTAGEVIIREGKPIDALFINLEGNLSVTLGDGKEVARLGAGEVVGEISFVDSAPPSATVSGAGTGRVLEIKRVAIDRKIGEDPGFAARFYKAMAIFLADRLRATTRRLGYGKDADLSEAALLEDELDPGILDTLAQAGDRFHRLLTLLDQR